MSLRNVCFGTMGVCVFAGSLSACGDSQPTAIAPNGSTSWTDASTALLTDGSVAFYPDGGGFYRDAGIAKSPGSGGTSDAAASVSDGDALPAEVCGVLQKNACMSCHGGTPAAGAPMPLSMASHFKATAQDGTAMAQKVLARVQDAQSPMPPGSTGKSLMSADDLSMLQSWINGGTQGTAGTECTDKSDVNEIGTDDTPSWATAPWPADQCEYIMTLGAHGQVGTPVTQDSTPFAVPTDTTTYHCFYEQVPWGDTPVHALALRATIASADDHQVVHHFVISGVRPTDNVIGGARPSMPGDSKPCDNPNGATMAVWAPGAINPLTYPSDVGVQLPTGADSYIEMQVHYNNPQHLIGKQSTVRYEICATSKLRPQTAGVFWLGYENAGPETLSSGQEHIFRLDNQGSGVATGQCSAKTQGRILSIMPHMHQRGIHSKFEIVRRDGTVLPIIDSPFDFNDEHSYFRQNLTVEQGDVARTTCQWDPSAGPVYFGFGTDSEMCFFYTLAYPIEVFQANALEKGFVGGDMACAHAVLQ